jgi:hypothetical protein
MEIKEKFEEFKKNEKIKKEINEALKNLEDFLTKFPFKNNPEKIDELTPDKIYEKENENTFLYWILDRLEKLGGTGIRNKKYLSEEIKNNLDKFKSLLKEALKEDTSLSKKIDLKWDEIGGMGDDKIVAKKIISCYYPDEVMSLFKPEHAKEFAEKLEINYEEEAEKRYNKNYKELSVGEKFELFNELFMEYKEKELGLKRNREDNVLFTRFLYSDEELKPKKSEKSNEEKINEEMEETPKKLTLSSILNALQTKPFLILAGISGTGKTQIARLIAWAMSEENNNKKEG